MNIKKVLCIVISIIIIVALIVGCLVYVNKNDNADIEGSTANEGTAIAFERNGWLTVRNVEELEKIAEDNQCELEYDIENIYAKAPFSSGEGSYSYRIDAEGNIKSMVIGYVMVSSVEENETFIMEEISDQEMSDKIRIALNWIEEELNVEIGENFSIFDNEGSVLSVNDLTSYKQILEGSASVELRVLDLDKSVWVFTVHKIGAYNIISGMLEHYPADSEQASLTCNVAISEPEMEIPEYGISQNQNNNEMVTMFNDFVDSSEVLVEEVTDETSADEVIEEAFEEITEDLTETETE